MPCNRPSLNEPRRVLLEIIWQRLDGLIRENAQELARSDDVDEWVLEVNIIRYRELQTILEAAGIEAPSYGEAINAHLDNA